MMQVSYVYVTEGQKPSVNVVGKPSNKFVSELWLLSGCRNGLCEHSKGWKCLVCWKFRKVGAVVAAAAIVYSIRKKDHSLLHHEILGYKRGLGCCPRLAKWRNE